MFSSSGTWHLPGILVLLSLILHKDAPVHLGDLIRHARRDKRRNVVNAEHLFFEPLDHEFGVEEVALGLGLEVSQYPAVDWEG